MIHNCRNQIIWPEVNWSEVTQSCPTLCDPMDCSPSGSSVHGIFQAIVLEWIAISFSRGSSQPRDRTQGSNPGLLHCRQMLYHLSHQGSHFSLFMFNILVKWVENHWKNFHHGTTSQVFTWKSKENHFFSWYKYAFFYPNQNYSFCTVIHI